MIALIFNLIGVVTNIINNVNRNLKGYAVHYLYGATLKDIIKRIIIYILFILIPPFIISYMIISVMQLFESSGIKFSWLYMILFIAISVGIVCFYPVKKLCSTDLTNVIRRD